MSPQNALIYVENIRKALVERPAECSHLQCQCLRLQPENWDIDQTLRKELAVIPRQTLHGQL